MAEITYSIDGELLGPSWVKWSLSLSLFLYDNLGNVYTFHNYLPSHILNCDGSCAQADKSGGEMVVVKGGVRQVYTISPHKREHISMLSCINGDGGCIPSFYILVWIRVIPTHFIVLIRCIHAYDDEGHG